MNKPSSGPSPDEASKERLRLWLRVLKATRFIEGQLRGRFREEFGSTLPRFDVMAALSRFENGLKMSQLSGVLRVSNGNVTGIIDHLVDAGLVVRVAVHGDRRATLVRMTELGHAEFFRQAAEHESWIDEMLGGFSAREASELSGRLDELFGQPSRPENGA